VTRIVNITKGYELNCREIKHKNKLLTIHKAITAPHFNEKTVLVTSTWDYVDLWLNRAGKHDARFFWNQAHSFYDATLLLPKTSAPLTAYYCFLNATKALLMTKGIQFSDQHGVSGYTIGTQTSLSNEKVKLQSGGILPALCQHLGESITPEIYTLKDLLYNLPGIHRAFDLSYSSDPELFIPVSNPKIVQSTRTHESWFFAELCGKYATQHIINKLPSNYEKVPDSNGRYYIKSKRTFSWKSQQRSASLNRFKNYHKRLRKDLHYVKSNERKWYIKRGGNITGIIPRSSMTIMFAAMHKLSEMARYTPDKLSKHFDCQHNWLLSEFLNTATPQFIDEISAELTGHEFITPCRN
jgi:hypothetical protein